MLCSANHSASFGLGWKLAQRDVDLKTNVPLTGMESAGVYSPLQEGSRVYISLPNGERSAFTFKPIKHEFSGVTYYTPSWTEDPGLGWVRPGAVLEAARARSLPLATDQRWCDAAVRIAARRPCRRHGLVAAGRPRRCTADSDVVSAATF